MVVTLYQAIWGLGSPSTSQMNWAGSPWVTLRTRTPPTTLGGLMILTADCFSSSPAAFRAAGAKGWPDIGKGLGGQLTEALVLPHVLGGHLCLPQGAVVVDGKTGVFHEAAAVLEPLDVRVRVAPVSPRQPDRGRRGGGGWSSPDAALELEGPPKGDGELGRCEDGDLGRDEDLECVGLLGRARLVGGDADVDPGVLGAGVGDVEAVVVLDHVPPARLQPLPVALPEDGRSGRPPGGAPNRGRLPLHHLPTNGYGLWSDKIKGKGTCNYSKRKVFNDGI